MQHASLRRSSLSGIALTTALLGACGGGGGAPATPAAPLFLVAGMTALVPTAPGPWTARVDYARFGLRPGQPVDCYELTTPAGLAFQFDLLSRTDGNQGLTRLELGHAADGGARIGGAADSMAGAGIVPSAPGGISTDPWLQAWGDGFARISLSGSVEREQILVARSTDAVGTGVALIRVTLGDPSAINVPASPVGAAVGERDRRTLYSSNSWLFGLPTVAVSGDRTSVVTYEGDRNDPRDHRRYRMRLQYDHNTHAVTGGGTLEEGRDSGHWRDHEIAALFNVLAVASSSSEGVKLALSYDRGATFDQTLTLAVGTHGAILRLVQIAIAADYSLAVSWWATEAGICSLKLVRGAPTAFGPGGSPTFYRFGAVETVRLAGQDAMPLLTGMTWSEGGDLVIGYGYTRTTFLPDRSFENRTDNGCIVIPWGGAPRDVLVASDATIGRDPSVATIGSGDTMQVFFAYEGPGGVRLAVSEDGGRTFPRQELVDDRMAHMPAVLARRQGPARRVDLLWLTQSPGGRELRQRHWDDYGSSPAVDGTLNRASTVPSATLPPGGPVPGGRFGTSTPTVGFRVTEIGFFGYDATLDGDDVVVAYDQQTYDAMVFLMPFLVASTTGSIPGTFASPTFSPASPPPLAPGLTAPVPAPDPAHMHQLVFVRID